MAEHEFLVTVEVTGWPDNTDIHGRTEADYAKAAINSGSLRDAQHLDGFADLPADAFIRHVEPI